MLPLNNWELYGKQPNLDRCPLGETTSSSKDVDSTIPVGSYVGNTDYPQELLKTGKFPINEVNLHVAEDGTVTGSSVSYISDEFVREDNGCVKHWEKSISGSFSGQLNGSHGTIGLAENWICVLFADCSDTGDCDAEPNHRQIEIQVSSD